MNIKSIVAGIALSAVSGVSLAGNYVGTYKISSMTSILKTGPDLHFGIKGNWENKDPNCIKISDKIWIIQDKDGSPENLKAMYAMALSAYVSGKSVQLYQEGCVNSRPKGVSMYFGTWK